MTEVVLALFTPVIVIFVMLTIGTAVIYALMIALDRVREFIR
jgi:hypothetical protein